MCLARLRVTPLHPPASLLLCPDEQGSAKVPCFSAVLLYPGQWPIALLALLLVLGGSVPAALAQPTTVLDLTNSVWRYNDSGQDLGTAWRNRNYSGENGWPSGVGLFGVEGTVPYPYPAP